MKSFGRVRVVALGAGAWAATLPGLALGEGHQFEAHGRYEHARFQPTGAVINSRKGQFSVYYHAGRWRIRTRYLTHSGGEAELWTGSTNAGLVYQVYVRTAVIGTNPPVNSPAYVQARALPLNSPDQVTHLLWVFFVSAEYLDARPEGKLCPVFASVAEPTLAPDLEVPAEVVRLEKPPRLPREITFMDPGALSVDLATGKLIRRPRGPPYNQPFLRARFRTEECRVVGDCEVPVRGVFEEFIPGRPKVVDSQTVEPQFVLFQRLQFECDEVAPKCSLAELMPRVEKPTAVIDFRPITWGRSRQPAAYVLGKGGWLPEKEVLERLEKKVRPRPPWLWAALGGLLLLPVLYLAARHALRRNR